MSFVLSAGCDLKGRMTEVVWEMEGQKPRGVGLCRSRDSVRAPERQGGSIRTIRLEVTANTPSRVGTRRAISRPRNLAERNNGRER